MQVDVSIALHRLALDLQTALSVNAMLTMLGRHLPMVEAVSVT